MLTAAIAAITVGCESWSTTDNPEGFGSTPESAAGTLSNISADELQRMLTGEKPPRLIDVRTSSEFARKRIVGTENLPLDQLGEWAEKISKDEEIVLICHSGKRSGTAQEKLAALGFEHTHNLLGGTAG